MKSRAVGGSVMVSESCRSHCRAVYSVRSDASRPRDGYKPVDVARDAAEEAPE